MDILCFVIGPNPGSNKSASGTKMRSVTKLSGRRERCIVTCKKKKKKTACISLPCAVIFLGFDFSSFLTLLQMCLCHIGGPPTSAFVGLQWAHGKRPTVCWEKEPFLPGTLFILCLCGNITDFALFFCMCSALATNRHFAHENPPTGPGVRSTRAASAINSLKT